jgi:hypothetical protein
MIWCLQWEACAAVCYSPGHSLVQLLLLLLKLRQPPPQLFEPAAQDVHERHANTWQWGGDRLSVKTV